MSNSLQPHGQQHSSPPCSSSFPKVCPNSCPLYQWCHPAISSSDALFSFCPQSFPGSGTFPIVGCSHQMTKILELQLQHQSFQWVFRVDILWDGLLWSPCCPNDFQESSAAPQFEGTNYFAFCLLCGPAFTTIHDHWEDHSLYYMDLCRQSNVSAFQHTVRVCHSFPAAKSLQSCLTLWDPIDGSPPGSAVPGILWARTVEWVAISFSNVWKWKVKVKSLSRVQLLATPRTAAYQVPPS